MRIRSLAEELAQANADLVGARRWVPPLVDGHPRRHHSRLLPGRHHARLQLSLRKQNAAYQQQLQQLSQEAQRDVQDRERLERLVEELRRQLEVRAWARGAPARALGPPKAHTYAPCPSPPSTRRRAR